MTIETTVLINFTDSERIALQTVTKLLADLAWDIGEIPDEISEKSAEAYGLITDLLGSEGQPFTPR